jgi:glyoxylase-like metal-dependent hydrolase (beta-lactamase superfamily II)
VTNKSNNSRNNFRAKHALLAIILSAGSHDGSAEPLIQNRGEDKDNWATVLPRPEWQAIARLTTDVPWFEAYQAAPDVIAIYEPGHFEEVISYLIVGGEKALLFDTGLGIGNMRALVTSLTDLPIIVVNSHTHYDHIGGNHQFATIAALDVDFARRNAAGIRHDAVAYAVADGWIAGTPPAAFDPARYRIEPFQITLALRDGDQIDIGGRIVEVIATPGHSPDSLCLIDRANRLLFTGDTFYLAPLYAHLEGSDVVAYGSSAARLARLATSVDMLLPGHNVTRVDPGYLERMAAAFDAVAADGATYTVADGAREYRFGEFSILTPATGLK